MKTLLAAAAALTLLAGSAMAATPLDCSNIPGGSQTEATAPGGGNSATGAQSTCETVVMPNGQKHVTNGPTSNAPGLSDTPNRSQ